MNYTTTQVEECAFEPESTEMRCLYCEKPTGVMGTCQDVGFCASCKQEFIDGAVEDGTSRAEAERRYSAMLIGMIEGKRYSVKYARKRVLHLSVDGKPACSAKGGPHPLTTNRDESNCKRCLRATQ